MRIAGKVFKDGAFWLVEIPMLGGLVSQGKTRKEAYENAEDYLQCLSLKESFKVSLLKGKEGSFELKTNNVMETLALVLKALRHEQNLTLSDVSKKMGQSSNTSYARVEKGNSCPTVDKFNEYFAAVTEEGIDFVLTKSQF